MDYGILDKNFIDCSSGMYLWLLRVLLKFA